MLRVAVSILLIKIPCASRRARRLHFIDTKHSALQHREFLSSPPSIAHLHHHKCVRFSKLFVTSFIIPSIHLSTFVAEANESVIVALLFLPSLHHYLVRFSFLFTLFSLHQFDLSFIDAAKRRRRRRKVCY